MQEFNEWLINRPSTNGCFLKIRAIIDEKFPVGEASWQDYKSYLTEVRVPDIVHSSFEKLYEQFWERRWGAEFEASRLFSEIKSDEGK